MRSKDQLLSVFRERIVHTPYRPLLYYCIVLASLCALQLLVSTILSMSLVVSLCCFHTGNQLVHHIITILCHHRQHHQHRHNHRSSTAMSVHSCNDKHLDVESRQSSTALKIDTDTEFNVYSYGIWQRLEVVLRFSNAIFAAIFCFAMITEALQRIIVPHEINVRYVWFLGVLGLFVNLCGVYLFSTDTLANPAAAAVMSSVASTSGRNTSQFSRSMLHSPIDGHNPFGGNTSQFASLTKARKQRLLFRDLVLYTCTNLAVLISSFLIEITGYESLDTLIAMITALWLFYLNYPAIINGT